MRAAWLGVVVGAGLVLAAAGTTNNGQEAYGQRVEAQTPSGEDGLIAVACQAGEGGQMLAVIDPKARVLSVYRIETGTGKVALCSVRNITWDLQMTHWNSESPLPQEIRSLLEQR